ncbi:L-rhamnose isomerase [Loktanella sp. SALINAS62]|uniref:L-rhamnose isomerase n=1 Tax=Loktanella sp. SALINAS62 TaxID=2706124 RepID=UPI001B8B41AC|nr:L-rhamnose isomerase [Loktanella sp. SALINAS62]MBS1302714.1 L-rhamnose isomerase [Loktanella sp. SALINAS62]
MTHAYDLAKAQYADWGVDTDAAIARLKTIPISMHCWQGDDVVGFEKQTGASGGGIQATGNHPGRARTPDELRADLDFAYGNIPGAHRLNLHAMYMDTDQTPDRDEITYDHFASWVDWAKDTGVKLDFNGTFFAHSKADDNLTLSHPDAGIRDFWIEHGKRCRDIAARFGQELDSPCITNVWVPDGYKDTPVDRMAARRRLEASLDAMFANAHDPARMKDAVESKLFGIGVEAATIGSHEFYLGYAIRRGTLLCLDMGHFHPTESVADKLSATALSVKELLLHVSRPMRWDSDHVILLDDSIRTMADELVSADILDRTHIGLDFFDATISRTAAWVIGTRNMQKALLESLLRPWHRLRAAEDSFDFSTRFMVTEEIKDLPSGAVWAEFCNQMGVPCGQSLISELERYQSKTEQR